jgi:hypothetical protein
MKINSLMTRKDRNEIAAWIVKLSDNVLKRGTTKAGWIPLKYESGPNSVAVVVSKSDRFSFLIPSTDLRNKAASKGFVPDSIEATSTKPCDKDRYRFKKLSLSDIQSHESLFREIVKASVRTIMDRRPKN